MQGQRNSRQAHGQFDWVGPCQTSVHLKGLLRAQEAGHEPVKQAPQLADAVLDRGATQDQAVRCDHRLACLQSPDWNVGPAYHM
jgi:hypothetical protein